MKQFSKVENNIVANMAKFDDSAQLPVGWIDTTNVPCAIGWPVVNGVPIARPSKWHTVTATNDGWEITPESQALKDESDATHLRSQDINNAQGSTGLNGITVDQARQIIADRLDIARALPASNLSEIQEKIESLCDQIEWLLRRVVVYLLK